MPRPQQLNDLYIGLCQDVSLAKDIADAASSHDRTHWSPFFDRLLLRLELWGDDVGYQQGALELDEHDSRHKEIARAFSNIDNKLVQCQNLLKTNQKSTEQIRTKQLELLATMADLPKSEFPQFPDNCDLETALPSNGVDADGSQSAFEQSHMGSLQNTEQYDGVLTPTPESSLCDPPPGKSGAALADVSRKLQSIYGDSLIDKGPRHEGPEGYSKAVAHTLGSGSLLDDQNLLRPIVSELRRILELLREPLTILASAASSLTEAGSNRDVSPKAMLWGIFIQKVESLENQNKDQLLASLNLMNALLSSLPRNTVYPGNCLEPDSLINEEDITTIYRVTLLVGLTYRGTQALHAYIDDQDLNHNGHILSTELSFASRCSKCLDKAAIKDYIRKHPNIPPTMHHAIGQVENEEEIDYETAHSGSLHRRHRISDEPVGLLTTHFRGRERELLQLADSVYHPLEGKTSFHVIRGLEGIGKTQLVLEFASFLWQILPHHHLFWICAASLEQLHRGLEKLLRLLGDKRGALHDPEALVQAVRLGLQRLGSQNASWTLFVDDVRDSKQVKDLLDDLLPENARNAQIIFTIRPQEIGCLDKIVFNHTTKLEVVALEDAIDIFASAAGPLHKSWNNADRVLAELIVKHLECFPMAVKQAGAYLKRFPRSLGTLYDLLTKVTGTRTTGRNLPVKVQRAIAATLHLTLEEIRLSIPHVRHLLQTLAFLHPESIPFGRLIESISENGAHKTVSRKQSPERKPEYEDEGLKQLRRDRAKSLEPYFETDENREIDPKIARLGQASIVDLLSSEADQDLLIADLFQTSMVGKRSATARPDLRMHDRVQDMILEQMDDDRRRKMYDQAVILVTSALQPLQDHLDKERTWSDCDVLAPHLQSLINKGTNYGLYSERLWRAYSNFGWYFYARGRYYEAGTCYQRCITAFETQMSDSPDSRTARKRLARVHMRLSHFHDAERELLKLFEFTEDGTLILSTHNLDDADELARCYYTLGLATKAERLYRRVHEMRTKTIVSDDNYGMANTIEGIANICQRRGEIEKARKLYRQVVRMRKKEIGAKYLSLQRARYNQARLYRDEGNLPKAIGLFKSVYNEYVDVRGKNHPDTQRVACRLAFTYIQNGQLPEAQKIAEPIEKQLAEDGSHYTTIGLARTVLAAIATQGGDYSRARRLYVQVLDSYQKYLGVNHSTTLYVRREYSDVLQKEGHYDEAIEALELVPEEFRRGTVLNTKLARLYDYQWSRERDPRVRESLISHAQELADETHELLERHDGKLSPETNYSLWVRARIYDHQGVPGAAADCYDDAIKGWDRIPCAMFGTKNEICDEYAKLLDRMGNNPKASETRSKMDPSQDRYPSSYPEPPWFSNTADLPDEDPNQTIHNVISDDRQSESLLPLGLSSGLGSDNGTPRCASPAPGDDDLPQLFSADEMLGGMGAAHDE